MRAHEFVNENFADGKHPERKGLAKRSGVNTKASVSSLRKTAKHSTGEKARMAHWLANMKAGRAKNEGEGDPEGVPHLTKELLQHIIQQVGSEGAHAIVKSLEWGDGAAKELLHLLVKDLKQDINTDLDEGWRDWVASAAIGAAALGGVGNADAAIKHKDLSNPSINQSVKKQEIKPIAPPNASQKELAKSVTGNPHEVYLKKAAEKAGIQGQELIAFLSQCAHETLDFKHMKEIGGSLDFKKYDPRYAPRKAKILGNTKPGDGAKYKGRGYIQITGKYNYTKAGEALGLDLVNKPELVEKPEVAAKVAVWYWKNRVANKVDSFKDTTAVTKGINPGLKHLDQRKDKMKSFQVAMK